MADASVSFHAGSVVFSRIFTRQICKEQADCGGNGRKVGYGRWLELCRCQVVRLAGLSASSSDNAPSTTPWDRDCNVLDCKRTKDLLSAQGAEARRSAPIHRCVGDA